MEQFSTDERRTLAQFFTNTEGPVFALVNLPEVVKGALFARYSRSSKSLRRLFLDEFAESAMSRASNLNTGSERAEKLYQRVLNEYGDDSVAQLGGAHVACEGVSNIVTKVLEWGRLMAYLEQSTRYVPYTDRPLGLWKYHTPSELREGPTNLRYKQVLDSAFALYSSLIEPLQDHFRSKYPNPGDSESVYRAAIRAKALDTVRGLLPAATCSNLGLYGTGQAFELLLIRMRSHPLAEARQIAALMLVELRKVIPAFLTRVDQAERGQVWSEYLAGTREATKAVAIAAEQGRVLQDAPEVTLTDFDPEGELKVVAAALYASTSLSDTDLLSIARAMSLEERAAVLAAYVGKRTNRRHKPGRAFERTSYRFDVLTDYGAFRDLQRHRLLTIEWQKLTVAHGYVQPEAIDIVGASRDWANVMTQARELHEMLCDRGYEAVAQYSVPMAYRVRFVLQMNAREAMHLIELRTGTQGHPAYRRVCQEMHRLITDQAGHAGIASAMGFVDHSEVELERLGSERRLEQQKRNATS